MNDPYAVLGVPRDADRAAIQAAYRHLARRHHPDFGGDHLTMATVNAAWGVLGDAYRRSAFDATRPGAPLERDRRSTDGDRTPIATAWERRRETAVGRGTTAAPSGVTLDFGRYAGWSLRDLVREDPEYLEWLARAPIGRAYRAEIDTLLSVRRAAAVAAAAPVQRPRSRYGRR
jgi:curved DNA-binding protein CbpA